MCWFANCVLFPNLIHPTPLVARSKACVWGRSLAGIAGSDSTAGVCCVLSSRSLCDVPILRPEEPYRVCVKPFSAIRPNSKSVHLH